MVRYRRAGAGPERPLYARMLGLRHVAPSGFLYFVFLEGAVALGILLALAELVSWWGVLVLPVTVALMVKLNDVVAGALARPAPAPSVTPRADLSLSRARTVDLRGAMTRPRAAGPGELDMREQRARQSAARRYE